MGSCSGGGETTGALREERGQWVAEEAVRAVDIQAKGP